MKIKPMRIWRNSKDLNGQDQVIDEKTFSSMPSTSAGFTSSPIYMKLTWGKKNNVGTELKENEKRL